MEAGTKAEIVGECCLMPLTGLFAMAYSSSVFCFLFPPHLLSLQPRTTCPVVALLVVRDTLSHQSLIRKMAPETCLQADTLMEAVLQLKFTLPS